MRTLRLLSAVVVCAGAVVAVALPASAGTSNLTATFQTHLGRGVPALPCDVDFCFTGTVAGHGTATLRGTVTGDTPIAGTACSRTTYEAVAAVADGSLELHAVGTVCPAGGSSGAPGSSVSYGNPITLSGTFAIVSGSGVFAGASGNGTFHDVFAGDVQTVTLDGTLTLP
jgi:hypothetical protein